MSEEEMRQFEEALRPRSMEEWHKEMHEWAMKHADDVKLWYNEDETRKNGELSFKDTEQYPDEAKYNMLLTSGWEPVRTDTRQTISAFRQWLSDRHYPQTPSRDQLRRDWFLFIKKRES
jgi:hypothetical protein